MPCRHAAALALVVLALSCSALIGVATAQISITPPAPQQRVAPAIPKFTVDQQGNLVAPDDKPVAAPNASGQNALEVPQVPKVFEGCWEGRVSEPDSWQHFGGPRLAGWIPSVYRVCFRRIGDASLVITFHDSKMDASWAKERGYQVSNYDEQTEIVSTDGKNVVSLHTVARFDESGRILGLIPGPTIKHGTVTDARCVIGEEALKCEWSTLDRCSGSEFFGCNGQPWVQATWHAQFHRTTNTSP